MSTSDSRTQGAQGQNEGEGSRTAARHYAEGVARTVESGQVDALADKAKAALEGPERKELEAAEAAGKAKSGDTAP